MTSTTPRTKIVPSFESPALASGVPPATLVIEDVTPSIDNGRFPIKREVGDELSVSADVFREGHGHIRVLLQIRKWFESEWSEYSMEHTGNDRWAGFAKLTDNTRYQYRIVALPDDFGSWRNEVETKLSAGLDVSSELQEGIHYLEGLIGAGMPAAAELTTIVETARKQPTQQELQSILLAPDLEELVQRTTPRETLASFSSIYEVFVDRLRARYASWYEIFPRSAGSVPGQGGTFDDVIGHLGRIQEMGFDVLYFPPIHPIGEVNRKGRNNSVTAAPGDPGSPYAIGSRHGGHDAIEPTLGTMEDFHRLVEEARLRDIEIAMDFAIQVAPDHPWSTDHPSWFFVRPDGTIKYAENPPKKYEDIYPINFSGEDWQGLWIELRQVVLFWIDQGVTIFRVDNPHTKPFAFWEWLIREVQDIHPEIIFLSEAFTRPKVMKALAKAGFTQSYTYFTWRNEKAELIEYFQEITNPPVSDYMRGNLFPTTPDILPVFLQEGGRPAFRIRLTLAATLSSVFGMYSGFELCEALPVPGKEEYLNSEKYELKVWDWDRAGNIRDSVTRINRIRRDHPALQEYDNLRFFWSANEHILCYGKYLASADDAILVVVNLDPYNTHDSMMYFPPEDFGLTPGEQFTAIDLIAGETFLWDGGDHYVRLDPNVEPAHVFWLRRKQTADYVDLAP
ncbi:alpha-1,4-glucan--maltose-1-phosphate maltosyltransferase [soil metagenome]